MLDKIPIEYSIPMSRYYLWYIIKLPAIWRSEGLLWRKSYWWL